MTTAATASTAAAAPPSPVAGPLRPGMEGVNIRTWTGFKHFMYLAEESVLRWFRVRGLGPSVLFHQHGLGLSVVDSSVLLPAVLDADDEVEAEVTGGPDRFRVRLKARRPGRPTVLRGRLAVALVPEPDAPVAAAPPVELAAAIGGPGMGGHDLPELAVAPPGDSRAPLAGEGAQVWSWQVPYYYCQYSRRAQHSAFVRVLEEAVDRFLAGCGLPIPGVLAQRGWIPVVSRARVSLLDEAPMASTVLTAIRVTDVFRKTSFDARMDCYVRREDRWVPVATGRILHAYAIARGPRAGQLAELDEDTLRALRGGRPAHGPEPTP